MYKKEVSLECQLFPTQSEVFESFLKDWCSTFNADCNEQVFSPKF